MSRTALPVSGLTIRAIAAVNQHYYSNMYKEIDTLIKSTMNVKGEVGDYKFQPFSF